jgi:hypothetical protein
MGMNIKSDGRTRGCEVNLRDIEGNVDWNFLKFDWDKEWENGQYVTNQKWHECFWVLFICFCDFMIIRQKVDI